MKVLFKEPPPSVKPHIAEHLGEVATVVNMKRWEGEKSPAMWLLKFEDSTMCWLKPQFLEIINEEMIELKNQMIDNQTLSKKN